MQFTPLALLLLLPVVSPALHCISHDNCGPHAVCVSPEESVVPSCICLLGYRGNGQQCVESHSGLASQSRSVVLGKQPTIVIEKCGGNLPQPQTTRIPPTTTPVPLYPAAKISSKSPAPVLSNEKTPCASVECDFTNGPCSYQNDYYSEWQLREIEGGTILLSTGDSKTEHYLLSGTFTTSQPSFLLFDYFESSYTRGHLSVYSNDLASLVWKASGKEPGWTQAVATLPAGRHQIIIASEKLSSQELVAVTNIRLIGNNGSPASCS